MFGVGTLLQSYFFLHRSLLERSYLSPGSSLATIVIGAGGQKTDLAVELSPGNHNEWNQSPVDSGNPWVKPCGSQQDYF